ncbi:MAG: hypothetical protein ACTSUE_10480 [Promethearchaeota archaeon]
MSEQRSKDEQNEEKGRMVCGRCERKLLFESTLQKVPVECAKCKRCFCQQCEPYTCVVCVDTFLRMALKKLSEEVICLREVMKMIDEVASKDNNESTSPVMELLFYSKKMKLIRTLIHTQAKEPEIQEKEKK